MKKNINLNPLYFFPIIFLFSFYSVYSQWIPVSPVNGPTVVYSLISYGNNLYAGTRYGPGAEWKGVYLSSNNGANWSHTFNSYEVWSLAANNGNIFAGTLGSGVYISSNNGLNWAQTELIAIPLTSALESSGNYLYAGCSNGLYITTNSGLNWNCTLNNWINSILTYGNYVIAGCSNDSGIYLSTNNGANWINTLHPANGQGINSLARNTNYIYAASTELNVGLYQSSNNGLNWIQTSFNNTEPINSVACYGSNIFLGVFLQGIYVSNDNGITWRQKNEGYPTGRIATSFCFLNNYIFVGSDGSGVYRRPLSELVGFHSISNEIPNQYKLYQNHPNPFNPTTKIKFQIPKYSKVTLMAYDVKGMEIAVLVNEQLAIGIYEIEWDASNEPSGMYFYTLTADSYSETKKLVLLK